MKTLPAGLAAMKALDVTTTAYALLITRKDAAVYGFTSSDQDVTISSVLYKANPGIDVTAIALSVGLNVDNLEITTLDDGTVFSKGDVLAGLWRGASFLVFEYNWANPADGINPIIAGTIGEVEMRRSTVVVELRGLQQILNEPVGSSSTPTCRYRLGVNDGIMSRCPVNLATFTVTGTVTGVTDKATFRDSGRTEAADWFGEGLFTFTSGPNAGIAHRVTAYLANGTFTMALPFLFTVAIGHTYSVSAGCRKRHDRTTANPTGVSDCKDKFNAVLDFGGEPHRPSTNDLVKPAEPAV